MIIRNAYEFSTHSGVKIVPPCFGGMYVVHPSYQGDLLTSVPYPVKGLDVDGAWVTIFEKPCGTIYPYWVLLSRRGNHYASSRDGDQIESDTPIFSFTATAAAERESPYGYRKRNRTFPYKMRALCPSVWESCECSLHKWMAVEVISNGSQSPYLALSSATLENIKGGCA